jgi:CheY-like chemotaxis protein
VRAQPAVLAGLRLLLVDDEDDARDLIEDMLRGAGARVVSAGSASEALRKFAEAQPDVLLSDIGMPGENGYDLIRQVRALPIEGGGGVPAIAITAFARPEDRSRALAAGFQLHLSKPIEQAQLLAAVSSLATRTTHAG